MKRKDVFMVMASLLLGQLAFAQGPDPSVIPFLSNNRFLQLSQEQLRPMVGEIVAKSCQACHGTDAGRPRGDFGFVDDLDRLAATEKYITPGDAGRSPLIIKVLKDIMPYGREPLSPDEKEILVAWVQGLGLPEKESRPFIDEKKPGHIYCQRSRKITALSKKGILAT